MAEFNQNAMIESPIILLAIFNVIPILISWYKNKIDNNQKILLTYACVMLLIVYPIVCSDHSKLALTFSVISFAYYIDKNTRNKYEKIKQILALLAVGYMGIAGIYNIIQWKNNLITDTNNPFFGAKYNENMDIRITAVTDYMKESEKRVIIVSPKASVFNLPMGINNGILDLPLKGNVGKNGKEKVLEEIKKLGDVKIILTKYRTYQEYQEVYEYVRENYEKVDTILNWYEVYELKQ